VTAPKIYVVLVNWNGWADSVECMESLLRSEHSPFSIILVDNASTDGSVERILAWARGDLAPGESVPRMRSFTSPPHPKPVPCLACSAEDVERAVGEGAEGAVDRAEARRRVTGDARVIVVRSGRNGGFGAGNNVAFKLVRVRGDGDFVWVLNNDTVVTPGAMSELARVAGATGAIVGGTLRYYHDPDRVQVYSGGRLSRWTGLLDSATRQPKAVLDYVNGACFMVSTAALERVGYFDERIFLYFEENDLCIRAGQRGLRCVPSSAVIYHKHGAASQGEGDSFAWRHVLQNKAYVLNKNWGLGLWFPVYICSLFLFSVGVSRSRGKRDAARRILATWVRNPRSALRPSPGPTRPAAAS
jgi:GT2 family glycosyltransferase